MSSHTCSYVSWCTPARPSSYADGVHLGGLEYASRHDQLRGNKTSRDGENTWSVMDTAWRHRRMVHKRNRRPIP